MLIGLPKEIKNHEYRVGLTPASVRELCAHGHQVLVQSGAGAAIGLTDEQYLAAGAQLTPEVSEVFAKADMIVKVKEPQPQECAILRPGQILVAAALLVVCGVGLGMFNPQNQALFQRLIPLEMQGRVASVRLCCPARSTSRSICTTPSFPA